MASYLKAWPSKAARSHWYVQVPGTPGKLFKRLADARKYRALGLRTKPAPDTSASHSHPPRSTPMATSKTQVLGVHVHVRRVVNLDGTVRIRRMAVAQHVSGQWRGKRQFEIGSTRTRKKALALASIAYEQMRERFRAA